MRRPNAPGTRKRHHQGWIVYSGAGGWEYEHRLVMARHIRRPLQHDERVRHRNGNLFDNRISNLELIVPHSRRANPWIECACGCGLRRRKFDSKWRACQFIHGHAVRLRRKLA